MNWKRGPLNLYRLNKAIGFLKVVRLSHEITGRTKSPGKEKEVSSKFKKTLFKPWKQWAQSETEKCNVYWSSISSKLNFGYLNLDLNCFSSVIKTKNCQKKLFENKVHHYSGNSFAPNFCAIDSLATETSQYIKIILSDKNRVKLAKMDNFWIHEDFYRKWKRESPFRSSKR